MTRASRPGGLLADGGATARGLAVVLGPEARKAWEKAGCQRPDFGSRIVAVRLEIAQSGRKRRSIMIVLVSAYAPDSGRPTEEHVDYEMQKQRLYDSIGRYEVMVEGTDANASLGTRSLHAATENDDGRDRVVGPHGIPLVNHAGKAFHQLLGMNQLCAATTYFRKTAHRNHAFAHTTWKHPGRQSPYQLDHFIVRQKDLKLVRDAGVWNHGVYSDHRAIRLKLKLDGTLIMPLVRSERVDRSLLQDPVTRASWRSVVAENVALFRGSLIDGVQATPLQVLERAMVSAAKQVLMSDGRRRPGWFMAAKASLGPVITARNLASGAAFGANSGPEAKRVLAAARK